MDISGLTKRFSYGIIPTFLRSARFLNALDLPQAGNQVSIKATGRSTSCYLADKEG
jgi:hypothetical protein